MDALPGKAGLPFLFLATLSHHLGKQSGLVRKIVTMCENGRKTWKLYSYMLNCINDRASKKYAKDFQQDTA